MYYSGVEVSFVAKNTSIVLVVEGEQKTLRLSEALQLQAQLARAMALALEAQERAVTIGLLVTPADATWEQTLATVDLGKNA